jgi:hypothetical protein
MSLTPWPSIFTYPSLRKSSFKALNYDELIKYLFKLAYKVYISTCSCVWIYKVKNVVK